MIYLITGTPGTGKTALLVQMMLDNTNKIFTFDDGTPRPLYFNHIDGLDKRKFQAHELTDEQITSAPLKYLVPEGSVIIVDECDYIYPLRGVKAPPPYVQTLKELRHQGFTLILLTQSATMLDAYVRRLVATHWHLVRRPIGTKLYEFQGVQDSLSETNLKLAAWKYYRPDKRTFNYYKSASVHISHKKRLHWAFYAFPIIIIITILMVRKALDPALDSIETVTSAETASIPASETGGISQHNIPTEAASTPGTRASDFIARLPDHPETAPLYDSLRKPVNMEVIVGCVQSANSCNCYSEQATLIKVSSVYCHSYIKDGKFDVYRKRVTQSALKPAVRDVGDDKQR